MLVRREAGGAKRFPGMAMGELLLFRPVGGQERKTRSVRGEPAQILFFTGVRYQRLEETPAPPESESRAPPSGGAGGGRRKRRG
jgi:hypothetical protein